MLIQTSSTIASNLPVPMENNHPSVLREYFTRTAYTSPLCIALPNMTANHFEIIPFTITLLPQFYGHINEDTYRHLDDFQGVCTTLKIKDVSKENLILRLFLSSLKEGQTFATVISSKLHQYLGGIT